MWPTNTVILAFLLYTVYMILSDSIERLQLSCLRIYFPPSSLREAAFAFATVFALSSSLVVVFTVGLTAFSGSWIGGLIASPPQPSYPLPDPAQAVLGESLVRELRELRADVRSQSVGSLEPRCPPCNCPIAAEPQPAVRTSFLPQFSLDFWWGVALALFGAAGLFGLLELCRDVRSLRRAVAQAASQQRRQQRSIQGDALRVL